MRIERFLIDEAGYVYERTNPRRLGKCAPGNKGTRLLGHISDLLREQTQLGKAVSRWWPSFIERSYQSVRGDSLAQSRSS